MSNGYQNPYFRDMLQPYPTNTVAVSMKVTLDEALIKYWGYDRVETPGIDQDWKMDVSRQGYPKVPIRFYKD
jgi:hypothetical protein